MKVYVHSLISNEKQASLLMDDIINLGFYSEKENKEIELNEFGVQIRVHKENLFITINLTGNIPTIIINKNAVISRFKATKKLHH